MRTICTLIVALACTSASAGPFRRATRAVAAAPAAVVRTAQDVANHMANVRVTGHWGGWNGKEGTGMGSTPDQALRNCCYHPQNPKWRGNSMNIEDQGVARGSDGMYYACIRGR